MHRHTRTHTHTHTYTHTHTRTYTHAHTDNSQSLPSTRSYDDAKEECLRFARIIFFFFFLNCFLKFPRKSAGWNLNGNHAIYD